MNRLIALAVGGALLIGATGVLIATAEQDNGIVLIAGDKPVTGDQVRQQMRAEGWSNVQTVRESRYLRVAGSKDGQPNQIAVDSQTGRLQTGDDDEE